jgi:PAS domain S-box-containing protein
MVAGDHARAEALLRLRLESPGDAGDEAACAAGLNGLGERVLQRGHVRHAVSLHRQALALYRRLRVSAGVAWSLQHLGEAARYRERYGSATVLHERAHRAFRALGDDAGRSRALAGLASIARRRGDLERARALYRESLHFALSVREERLIAIATAGTAGIALDTGRPRAARLLLHAVRRLLAGRQSLPGPDHRSFVRDVRKVRSRIRAGHGARRWRKTTASSVAAWLAANRSFDHLPPDERPAGSSLPPSDPPAAIVPGVNDANPRGWPYRLALLRALSETSLDGIIVVSTSAAIAHLNRRFAEMWGLPWDAEAPPVREEVTALMMAQVADTASYLARSDYLHHHPDEAFSAEFALKDGRVVEHYSAPVVGEDGTRYGRVGYYRDVTERKRAGEQISTQRDALRRQVGALREARAQATLREERLRREIAEVLHGRVQTQLVVAHHRASRALDLLHDDPSGAEALLRQLRDEIDDIRENGVRRASHLLHPTVISLGLLPALAYLQERFRGTLEITMAVDRRLAGTTGDDGVAVPEPVALAAYRVIEEALANASLHAGVSTAQVALNLATDRALEATVTDSGRGFVPHAVRGGLGFRSIASRVDEHRGTWSVRSAPGAGTTVTARFPLAPARSVPDPR